MELYCRGHHRHYKQVGQGCQTGEYSSRHSSEKIIRDISVEDLNIYLFKYIQ